MSNTKTQATRRAAKRSAYDQCLRKGLSHNQALSVVYKAYGNVSGLNAAHCEAVRQTSRYKPTFKDVAQYAPRRTIAHGMQRAGYAQPKNMDISLLGNLDAMIPVSQIANDAEVQRETSVQAIRRNKRDALRAKSDKRQARLARIEAIETGKENQALLSMQQALMIYEANEWRRGRVLLAGK